MDVFAQEKRVYRRVALWVRDQLAGVAATSFHVPVAEAPPADGDSAHKQEIQVERDEALPAGGCLSAPLPWHPDIQVCGTFTESLRREQPLAAVGLYSRSERYLDKRQFATDHVADLHWGRGLTRSSA